MKRLHLLLVYNADAGRLAAGLESLRKLLRRPGCSLCALTHGLHGERPAWSNARAALAHQLGLEFEEAHRDELDESLHHLLDGPAGGLPAIVLHHSARPRVLLGPEEIAACSGPEELAERLAFVLGAEAPRHSASTT